MNGVILGVHLSAPGGGEFTADGNVAVVIDGRPTLAVAQERVTRRKYDGGFAEAAHAALESLGLAMTDVDIVAVSTFGRSNIAASPDNSEAAALAEQALGTGPDYVVAPSHHDVHATAAAAQCPDDRALVAVIDNEGSIIGPRSPDALWMHRLERTSYYLLDGDALRLIARDHTGPGEVGYGKAYSKVTRYVGFRSYQESGKTMALAAFGARHRFDHVRLFTSDDDGQVHTALRNSEDGLADLARLFAEHGDPLPPPRRPGDRFDPLHLDLAAWCQHELEVSVGSRIAGLRTALGVDAVCGAGGVFLNSVLNRALQDRLQTPRVFVPPSPADTGLALGAAAWWLWTSTNTRLRWTPNPYLGAPCTDSAISRALAAADDVVAEPTPDPIDAAVAELAAGGIVGWFQGGSEYGPRALGNRSILADPSNPWVREILNNLVKHREWFRPYAPVSTEECAESVYDLAAPVPFMMHTAPVRPERVRDLPGGVHIDGSARLQTVSADQNPILHELIARFSRTTGVPALLNTSMNVDGMPIVESPADAFECLRRAPGLDTLYLGGYRITRAAHRSGLTKGHRRITESE
jgi:carbamoyltransferase